MTQNEQPGASTDTGAAAPQPAEYVIVNQRLWWGGRYLPIDSAFPTENVPPEKVQQLLQGGFIATRDDVEYRRNPEAVVARRTREQAASELGEARERIDALLRGKSELEGKLTPLVERAEKAEQDALAQRTRAERAEAALDAMKARQQILEARAYPSGPTPLPNNFPSRGALVRAGYENVEDLAGRTADQLAAIDGVTPDKAGRILAERDARLPKPAAAPAESGADGQGAADQG